MPRVDAIGQMQQHIMRTNAPSIALAPSIISIPSVSASSSSSALPTIMSSTETNDNTAAMIPVAVVVICSLTLSFLAAVGVNVQKLSMNRETKGRQPFLQPLWLLGTAIIVLDAIGDFVFIGLAPQSLLAPLGSLALGWNVILAPIFHKDEKVTKTVVIATAIIYIGTILTILNAATSTPSYDLGRIFELIKEPFFIVYLVFTLSIQGGLILHGKRYGFRMLHYTAIAGSLGGETMIFAKTSSEIVKNAILEHQYDDMKNPFIYLAIIMTITLAVTQLHVLNTGLAKFEALMVIPVYQSFFNVFAITGGLIFFQEYQGMTRKDGIFYTCGILITLIGVKMLVQHRRQTSALRSEQLELNEFEVVPSDHDIDDENHFEIGDLELQDTSEGFDNEDENNDTDGLVELT